MDDLRQPPNRARLQPAPGERVIWEGVPARGPQFGPADFLIIPFAALWLFGFLSIFFIELTEDAGDIDPMGYVMFPIFLLVGFYMLVGRFLWDMAVRRNTRYVLTDRRAIIEAGLFRSSVRSINLAVVPEIRFQQGRRTRGTVQFGSHGLFGFMPAGWPGTSQSTPPSFQGIDEAEHVYQMALAAQREAQSAR